MIVRKNERGWQKWDSGWSLCEEEIGNVQQNGSVTLAVEKSKIGSPFDICAV
ncbi:hypothetical protein SERLA73DRAFT_182087 [Serpula lacrymans var. lacrymans S7.3]|uniref:Uncharacterized protein n=2 Tax=Serpula lacrymans var. lacrymans TaxID=341189 RepID=F8PZ98_SERL3|nr:uncharacterized protein SERLADRAFT_468578 [Serpula lacrymans var. lacrymans S7.9]EGN99211.1 hypothetical protein SERLA73DRAFT_182087 [Serpula lacrymans var. lacrymans S7.3]EGO24776.1 hypothetical protein SERLADRAFT_468578 [Serpula lacrymans var. lacrymans S7.9]